MKILADWSRQEFYTLNYKQVATSLKGLQHSYSWRSVNATHFLHLGLWNVASLPQVWRHWGSFYPFYCQLGQSLRHKPLQSSSNEQYTDFWGTTSLSSHTGHLRACKFGDVLEFLLQEKHFSNPKSPSSAARYVPVLNGLRSQNPLWVLLDSVDTRS